MDRSKIIIKKPKDSRSNIFILGIVSLLNDFSSEMIMPILPMFITALGGAGMIVGLIGGLRDSISSILNVVCGYWSDKAGRRKIFVISGYATSSVFKLLLAFSTVWQHILVFASLERIGKGLRTASRDAIISESMPEAIGKGFGIHRAFDTIGAILGSSMVLVLYWSFQFNFKSIILIAAALSLLSLFPLTYVKETQSKPQDISLKISLIGIPKQLKLFILISGVFSLANFSYMFFILRAQEFFAGKLSIGVPIILYILFNIFYAIFAIPFGKIADKIGRKKAIVSGYFLFSITCMGFALFHSLTAFIILFALYGIVYALVDGNQRAYVSDLSKGKLRATALGTYHTIIGLIALPSSLFAGFLFQHSPELTFIFGAAVSLISVVLFIFMKNERERTSFKNAS